MKAKIAGASVVSPRLRGADTRTSPRGSAVWSEIVELLQQQARLAVIGLAGFGEAELAGGPVHQPDAEIVLEVGDIFRQQRLGAPVLPRRGREPASIEHLHEGPDTGEVLAHAFLTRTSVD